MPFGSTASDLRTTPHIYLGATNTDGLYRPQGNVFLDEAKNLMVKTGPEKQQPGELSTEDIQNDSMYLCPVTIGEGPQAITLNLDFDTGSSDLWGAIFFRVQRLLVQCFPRN